MSHAAPTVWVCHDEWERKVSPSMDMMIRDHVETFVPLPLLLLFLIMFFPRKPERGTKGSGNCAYVRQSEGIITRYWNQAGGTLITVLFKSGDISQIIHKETIFYTKVPLIQFVSPFDSSNSDPPGAKVPLKTSGNTSKVENTWNSKQTR